MNIEPIKRTTARIYDGPRRYWVKSRSGGDDQLTDLDAYNGNGWCGCKDFAFNFEKLLQKTVTPAQAVERGLIKPRKDQKPWDQLRCWHLVEARAQYADDQIAAAVAEETAGRPKMEEA